MGGRRRQADPGPRELTGWGAPGVPFVEFPGTQLVVPLMAEPIRFAGGAVSVPDRPGLGADPDPSVRARYPYRAARPFYLT